jgi:hypothetical protein
MAVAHATWTYDPVPQGVLHPAPFIVLGQALPGRCPRTHLQGPLGALLQGVVLFGAAVLLRRGIRQLLGA